MKILAGLFIVLFFIGGCASRSKPVAPDENTGTAPKNPTSGRDANAAQANGNSPHRQAPTSEFSEAQAIAAAEKFVERNGYTDLPPDRENLAHESVEISADVDKVLELRRDTLERRAFGVSRGAKGRAGWTVIFKHKEPADGVGRAVTMRADGGDMRMEHKNYVLEKAEKKLSKSP